MALFTVETAKLFHVHRNIFSTVMYDNAINMAECVHLSTLNIGILLNITDIDKDVLVLINMSTVIVLRVQLNLQLPRVLRVVLLHMLFYLMA